MSRADLHAWVVSYDISSPRRWAKVYRLLSGSAMPLQYSVFLFVGTVAEILAIVAAIKPLIDADEDDVRTYKLARRHTVTLLGKPRMPADIELLGRELEVCPDVPKLLWHRSGQVSAP